ncbi:hypothetical protein GCM10011408_25590 [Dyella caseinilytica]|nr:hypothetical protein GCM10011408_25590 [Dyella caseinilytica]
MRGSLPSSEIYAVLLTSAASHASRGDLFSENGSGLPKPTFAGRWTMGQIDAIRLGDWVYFATSA